MSVKPKIVSEYRIPHKTSENLNQYTLCYYLTLDFSTRLNFYICLSYLELVLTSTFAFHILNLTKTYIFLFSKVHLDIVTSLKVTALNHL